MSKARQIETSIDEARKNKDWATALSHVKRYAKVNANGSSILEDIILAESLLEKDPSQSKTVLSKVLSKEPSNEVNFCYFLQFIKCRTHYHSMANSYFKTLIIPMPFRISPR